MLAAGKRHYTLRQGNIPTEWLIRASCMLQVHRSLSVVCHFRDPQSGLHPTMWVPNTSQVPL